MTTSRGVARSTRRLTRPRSLSVASDGEPSSAPPPKTRKLKRQSRAGQSHPDEKAEEEHVLDEKPVLEGGEDGTNGTVGPDDSKADVLKDRKLKAHSKSSNSSPFPDFTRPTPSECALAHRILGSLHGTRVRPKEVVASKTSAGCGASASVLDALVRTILSQNTSDANSTRSKLSMDEVYGGSDHWAEIVAGGREKLQESIRSGGLSAVKSKVILNILGQVKEKYGEYTLDHLHRTSTEAAMEELLSFDGVGPKTASCVLLFCLNREDFAVDTHVHRITGLLGWRPKNANREQTYHHLNRRIPDEDKYGLHVLLVTHGKRCDECKAGGRVTGKCELRKAFRAGAIKGEVEEGVKEEIKDGNPGAVGEGVEALGVKGEADVKGIEIQNDGVKEDGVIKDEVHGLNVEQRVKEEV